MMLVMFACDDTAAPLPGEVRVTFDVESMWLEGVTGFTARVWQAEAPDMARDVMVPFVALEELEPFETSLDCERGDVTIEVEAVAGECEEPRKLSRVVACPSGGSVAVVLDGLDFPRPEVTAHALSLCVPSNQDSCSAKVDVVDALLFDPVTEERGPTLVIGTACVSKGVRDYAMYASDVRLVCDGNTLALPLASAPTGDGAPYPPLLARSAKYVGIRLLSDDYFERYLNGAWLLTPEALASTSCTVEVAYIFAPDGLPDAHELEHVNPMHIRGYRVSAQFIEAGRVIASQSGDAVMRRLTADQLASLQVQLAADLVFEAVDAE